MRRLPLIAAVQGFERDGPAGFRYGSALLPPTSLPAAGARQVDRQRVLRCQGQNAVDGLMAGSAGSVDALSRRNTRMPTVPSVAAQSAIVSVIAGSVGS